MTDLVLISRDEYTMLCIFAGLGWGLLFATVISLMVRRTGDANSKTD